jgi:hypothetical protein
MGESMPFDSVRAKLNRAQRHLAELDSFIISVFSDDANIARLGTRFEAVPGSPSSYENILYVSYAPDLSNALRDASAILGDAIHNLRSALDHLAYELSMRTTPTLTEQQQRQIYFSICENQAAWKDRSAKDLKFVSATDRNIIESFQPFNRKDAVTLSNTPLEFHPLTALHQLDNVDKHRLITTVISDAGGFGGGADMLNIDFLMAFLVGSLFGSPLPHVIPVEQGAIVRRFSAEGDHLSENDALVRIIPNVSLEDGTPIVPMLGRMIAMVTEIIDAFDPPS